MGDSVIAVPIHLDALYVEKPSAVAPEMADFSRLPFFDGQRDVNLQAPWLGETAAREPFTGSKILKRGIHLHWRFPSALTHGTASREGKIVFPNLPERWLVTRGRETGSTRTIEDQWVVESNYLHPEGVPAESPTYPLEEEPPGRCYRHLGRAVPLAQWRRHDRQGQQYLGSPLTAAGYGEPTYASFYPNCSHQFGFHDPKYWAQIPAGLYYQVIGWYSSQLTDWLRVLIERRAAELPSEDWRTRLKKVLDGLRWSVEGDPTNNVVLACHGSVVFRPDQPLEWEPHLDNPAVTFGATITEALSAFLANETAGGDAAKKEIIEDQLEAIMLDRVLSNRSVDVAAKFKEARHEKGFEEVSSGVLWTVRAKTDDRGTPGEDVDTDAWPDVAEKLETLNRLQNAYHLAWDEIRSLRERLHSDWCRYMRSSCNSAATNSSTIRALVERETEELHRKTSDAGTLDLSRRDSGSALSFSETRPGSLASQVSAGFRDLLASLHAHEAGTKTRYLIQPSVAPRYWRPAEPVILLTGEAARMHEPAYIEDLDSDAVLKCDLLKPFVDIDRRITFDASSFTQEFPYKPREWKGQPWHPLLLEWEVELAPFPRLSNLTTADSSYEERFITRNFTLKRNDADFTPRTIAGKLEDGKDYQPPPGAMSYQGSSLLTPHVADQFLYQLHHFLERVKSQEQSEAGSGSEHGAEFPFENLIQGAGENGVKEAIDFLVERFERNPPRGLNPETIRNLGDVLRRLQQGNVFCLAQRLSGFNDALLQHEPTLRLPIRHPLGFVQDVRLARMVNVALGGEGFSAPQTGKYFSPIRAGEITVKRLRLVSTFGRHLDFECASVVTATPMQPQTRRGAAVFLPPRLAQPARMQFRWLSGGEDEKETNAHPDSSPLCGWVIPNYLDDNLFFYSSDGQVLGYMEVEHEARVRWRPAPGALDPVIGMEQIPNRFLRRMIEFFLSGSADYFNRFVIDLQAAQGRIEPEHAGDPLPMGQPLALVRATLSLELQGLPAIQRNWLEAGASPLHGPESDRFTGVRFPIRLGEQDQLNDGLAVYWLENADGSYADNAYVIPNYDEAASGDEKKCDFLYQSIDDAPLKVTMLMDPRGVVHAATGVLPSKAIRVPLHFYSSALKRFEIMFLAAPVIAGSRPATGDDTIALPVTDPPGYRWSWFEKRGDFWITPSIDKADLYRPFAGTTELREGWLKLSVGKDKEGKV